MKSDNKLYKHISIGKRLLSQKMFIFSDIFEIQIENDSANEKTIPDRKEMSEGNNTEKKNRVCFGWRSSKYEQNCSTWDKIFFKWFQM